MCTTAVIFDIQRFSLSDGPGIRTTVFIKGCPLRCEWCHNPESQRFAPQLLFNAQGCSGCGACANACVRQVHSFSEDGVHSVHFDKCVACGKCVDACANDALRIVGREMTPRQVMDDVIKDLAYFQNSGGGLTVSGGEPLASPDFLLELLRMAKADDLHICVETSLHAPWHAIELLVNLVDLWLVDFKLSDDSQHRLYTGAGTQLIQENLYALVKLRCKIVLRCPIIPGINDHQAHFRAIAALAKQYGLEHTVELMPYHAIGKGKASMIGRDYLIKAKSPQAEQREQWRKAFELLGLPAVSIL